MTKLVIFSALAALFVLLAACAPTPTTAPAPTTAAQPAVPPAPVAQAKPYRVGMISDLRTANYWNYQGPGSSVYNKYVMAPTRLHLYNLDDKRFDVIPEVATGIDAKRVTDGGKVTITVPMRKGVKWSDGKELTAKDVAFTANTAIELELPGNWSSSIFDRNYIEKAEAVDDYTAKFTFKKAPGLGIWEYGVAQAPILSEAFWAPVVNDAKKSLAGVDKSNKDAYAKALKDAQQTLFNYAPQGEPLAGSFTFVKWEKGAFVENKGNDSFFFKDALTTVYKNGGFARSNSKTGLSYKQGDATGEKLVEYAEGPTVASAVYTIYGTQDAAILALKKGEIDYWINPLGLGPGLKDQVANEKDIATISNATNGFRYMAFNVRKKPMADKEFRQAMAYLIDKEFVTKTILQGVAFPLYTEVPSGNAFWYNANTPKIGQGMNREDRLNKAIELLTKAGYKWEGDKKPTWDKTALVVKQGGRLLMPDGTPMPQLALIAPSAGYDPLRSTFAIWIERWANEVGIPLKAELIGFNELIDRVNNDPDYAKKLDMYILGWSVTIFPNYLDSFHDSRFAGPGDQNAGGYSNPDFDKLGTQLSDCQTYDECQKIAFKMQDILADELPYIVLFDTGIIESYRTVVKYPYTETLSGLQYQSGLADSVSVIK